jgi:hypothetical protein
LEKIPCSARNRESCRPEQGIFSPNREIHASTTAGVEARLWRGIANAHRARPAAAIGDVADADNFARAALSHHKPAAQRLAGQNWNRCGADDNGHGGLYDVIV